MQLLVHIATGPENPTRLALSNGAPRRWVRACDNSAPQPTRRNGC